MRPANELKVFALVYFLTLTYDSLTDGAYAFFFVFYFSFPFFVVGNRDESSYTTVHRVDVGSLSLALSCLRFSQQGKLYVFPSYDPFIPGEQTYLAGCCQC